MKWWARWKNVLGSTPWKANMGDTMRSIAEEPTPFLRQTAYPTLLSSTPLADITIARERIVNTQLHWQDFVSPQFNFLPEFQDFAKHTERNMAEIVRQMEYFYDVYYRTQVWEQSPYVYIAGVGLVAAPTGTGDAAYSTAKSNAWLQGAVIPQLLGSSPGNLSFQEIWRALNVFEQEVGGTPHEGTGEAKGMSRPLDSKYALMCSSEAWNNFLDDPWLKENRPLNMNIVSESFKGDLFGRVMCSLEGKPMRIALDTNNSPTRPAPDIVELNPNAWDYGRTKPNPGYAKPNLCQLEVAYLVGGNSHDIIETGPPPSAFTESGNPDNFAKMSWNGRPYMTKNFLTYCKDSGGNMQVDTNSFGRYLRFQGTACVGISPRNPQNVLPIIFKRRYALTTYAS